MTGRVVVESTYPSHTCLSPGLLEQCSGTLETRHQTQAFLSWARTRQLNCSRFLLCSFLSVLAFCIRTLKSLSGEDQWAVSLGPTEVRLPDEMASRTGHLSSFTSRTLGLTGFVGVCMLGHVGCCL